MYKIWSEPILNYDVRLFALRFAGILSFLMSLVVPGFLPSGEDATTRRIRAKLLCRFLNWLMSCEFTIAIFVSLLFILFQIVWSTFILAILMYVFDFRSLRIYTDFCWVLFLIIFHSLKMSCNEWASHCQGSYRGILSCCFWLKEFEAVLMIEHFSF